MMKSGSLAAQGFSLSLMSDFVAYIDRSAQTTRTHLTNLRQFGPGYSLQGYETPSAGIFCNIVIGLAQSTMQLPWTQNPRRAGGTDAAPAGFPSC